MNELDKILKLVSRDDFLKGRLYLKNNVRIRDRFKDGKSNVIHFHVDSQSRNYYYDVYITYFNGVVEYFQCDCPQYRSFHHCKHVAACLRLYKDEIFKITIDPKKISSNILKNLMVTNKVKKQLKLDVTIINSSYPTVELKVGYDKMYSLNNKLSRFIDVYDDKLPELEFGKLLTYNKEEYYFNDVDQRIIDYIIFYKKTHPINNSKLLEFNQRLLKEFLKLMKEKEFTYLPYGNFNGIIEENVISTNLSKKEDYYTFKFDSDIIALTADYEYVIKDNKFYHTPKKVIDIINMMKNNYVEELIFKENELDNFSKAILPRVKDNIKISEELKDKIIVVNKPDVKLYFDIKNNVTCKFKLKYKDQEIDYFDKVDNILRDVDCENEVITDLTNYNFIIENKKIYIKDIEDIGYFLEVGLLDLSSKYEIYTSDKLKETSIRKNISVKSSFGIGKDNIMSYKFELKDIDNSELFSILDSLKNNKKYYKLKSGDLINLNENQDLIELNNLVEDLELSNNEINEGHGVIPKYKAIYLDSLNYSIINTNNLFNELINKFNNYKNIDINVDNKILRDYQVTGVKWLYNIYKCGFGGILADEMGLGKSIQLIYFIKQILKEKKCKILIVSPTSLIYNWENEFNKFGSELNYQVIAENKLKRNELLHNTDADILITTYGLVRQDLDEYLKINFELVVIDEAQNIKNPNALMTKAIKSINANTKIALTGTPLENNVLELWSIFDFIMPGYLASINKFTKKYNLKDVNEEELNKLNSLNKQIKPFILRRMKKNVIKDLPDKIENNIYIDLNENQKKVYAAQVNKTNQEIDEIIEKEGFDKARFKILQLLTKLRQICIDPKIVFENYNGGSSKIEYLVSLVKEIIANEHKILLFTSYKTALDIVNKEFDNNNISTYIIDGGTPSKKRMELVNKFNNDDTNVFLIMLKAGGTGLNLTSADVVIHLDLWWNPQVENQATDRAHRIGQLNTVEVIKLICKGTIEERILELQNKKKILSDNLIDSNKLDENMITNLTAKDIKKLISLDMED